MPEKEFKNAVIHNANIQTDFKVLDFGIGTATLSIMASLHQPKATYIGIDVDNQVLEIANKKIINSKSNIELLKYDGNKLPFSDNSFDRIITSLVIHHLTTDQKLVAFSEFKRVLKPNGEIHIADWGKASNFLMKIMFNIVQFLDDYKTTNDNVKGKIPNFLEQVGFNQIEIKQKFNTVLGTVEVFKIINNE